MYTTTGFKSATLLIHTLQFEKTTVLHDEYVSRTSKNAVFIPKLKQVSDQRKIVCPRQTSIIRAYTRISCI